MKYTLYVFLLLVAVSCGSGTADDLVATHCDTNQSQTCRCSSGQTRWKENGLYRCVDFDTQNFCLNTPQGFTKALQQEDSSLFERCLIFKPDTVSLLGFTARRFIISTTGMSAVDKQDFAEWADQHHQILNSLPFWSSAAQDMKASELYHLGYDAIGDFLNEIFNPVLMPVLPASYLPSFIAPKYFSDIKSLLFFLENPKEKLQINVNHFNFDPRASFLAKFYTQEWNKELVVEDINSVQGCAVSCTRVAIYKNVEGFDVEHRDYVVEGVPYRSELVLKDVDGQIVATIYMVNRFFVFLSLFDRDPYGLAQSKQVYAPDGQNITPDLIVVPTSGEQYLNEREFYINKTTSFDFSVGVCEANFNPQLFLRDDQSIGLHFGPYTPSSYFGWVESPIDRTQFWQGRVVLNDWGLDNTFYTLSFSDHAKSVSDFFVKDKKHSIGVVPLGIDQCLEAKYTNSFLSTLKSVAGIRVINLSVSNYIDRPTCEVHFRDHPLVTEDDVLWVVAAGNQSYEGPRGCPQYFSGKKNVIIVSSSKNGIMKDYSNYGDNFSDIAANGDNMLLNDRGTSFAAPRVSVVAARLLYTYPLLTASQAKMSLLLGARYVNETFPVRSHGELDENLAFQYAQAFHEGLTPEQAIDKIACNYQNVCNQRLRLHNLIELLN